METQLRMYLAGTIAAVVAFLFVSLAFSGQFNFIHGGVYIVFFIVVMVVFANFVKGPSRSNSTDGATRRMRGQVSVLTATRPDCITYCGFPQNRLDRIVPPFYI